jgi:MFS family permease
VNKRLASLALWGLLLVLALRMTMTETVRETLGQLTGMRVGGGAGLPEIGPAVTTGLAAITFLLAGVAAWCAGKAGVVSWGRAARLGIVTGVLVLGGVSTFFAANRFVAAVGLCDVGMGLLAGWSVGVLCDSRLLGMAGRRTVIAAVMALAAVWTMKGIYQRTIDIPETIKYYELHKDEALAQALGPAQSRDPNSSEVKLFESRMNSKEVSGYVTLSNVMGAGMVGLLAVLAGLAAARVVDPIGEEDAEKEQRPNEISWPALNIGLVIVLGLAGLVTLFLTASRGGSVMGAACVVAMGAAAFCWRRIVARRRMILIAVGAAMVLSAAAVIGYGVMRDTLPMRTLMFRWHYWTASAQLVERSPILGVGLNNFGDYYTEVKRASSPEDVKDPHSFFVRIAAEMGVPAAVLLLALIVWMVLASTKKGEEEKSAAWDVRNAMMGGVLFCGVWWVLHQLLAEPPDEYSVILSGLAAVIAAGGWALADGLMSFCGGRGMRFVAIGAVVGAVGMLVYDQINMALVTGPVAMFFWVSLGLGESWTVGAVPSSGTVPPRKPGALSGQIGGVIFAAAGVVIAAMVWWPTLRGTMAWDPLPWEEKYLAATQGDRTDFAAAERALDEAIARSPRSTELLRQRVLVKLQLHESTAEDVHRILELDRTSARVRVTLATTGSDLPAAERIEMLEEAMRLDAQLPGNETTRLSAQEHAGIDGELAELRKSAGQGK